MNKEIKRIIEFEPDCGETIQKYAERCMLERNLINKKLIVKNITLLNSKNEIEDKSSDFVLHGLFNGVDIYTDDDSTIDSIVNFYHSELDILSKEYKKSEEYKQKKLKEKQEVKELQIKCDKMIENFKNMDLNNYKELLIWLKEFFFVSDRIGVNFDKNILIKNLKEYGYYKDMNIKENYIEHDKVNNAEYIVGQALCCLENYGILHQVLPTFVDRWLEEFDK